MAVLRLRGVDTTTGQENDLTTADNFATGAINIGAGVTPTSANGDIVAGDGDGTGGTGSFTWTTSTGIQTIQRDHDATTRYRVVNDSSGTSANAAFVAVNDTGGALISAAYSSTSTFSPNGAVIYAFSAGGQPAVPLHFYANSPDTPFVFNLSGGAYPGSGWRFDSETNGRHFRPSSDGLADIGTATVRPRRMYLNQGIRCGTSAFLPGAGDIVGGDGTRQFAWDASAGTLAITGITAAGSAISSTGSVNGFISHEVSNTNAGAGAYARFLATAENVNGAFVAYSGASTAYPDEVHAVGFNGAALGLRTNEANPVHVWTNSIRRWTFDATGHITAFADNSYDIGAITATRPRSGFFGTSLVVNGTSTNPTVTDDLALIADGAATSRHYSFTSASATQTSAITLMRYRGSAASPALVQSGDFLGIHTFQGAWGNAIGSINTGAQIYVTADANWTISSTPASIHFTTCPTGGVSATERLRISEAGGITVGDVATLGDAALGDIVAGNSTALFSWDASATLLNIVESSSAATTNTATVIHTAGEGGLNRTINIRAASVPGGILFTPPTFSGTCSRGTLASPAAVQNADLILQINSSAYHNTTTTSQAAYITFRAGENWDASNTGSHMEFAARPAGTAAGGTPTPLMRYSGEGGLSIGVTTTLDRGDLLARDGSRIFSWDASANNLTLGLEAATSTIQGIDATTAATAGASLTIAAGDGNTTGAGGSLDLQSGASASGTPGVVTVNSLPLATTLSQTASVDLTATGTTSLYTVPTGRSAVITGVVVRPTTATTPGGDAAVSVGTNASTYDDIVPNTTLTALDATTEAFVINTGGIIHVAAAAEVVTFQVDTADTGTALTVTIELIGYLL